MIDRVLGMEKKFGYPKPGPLGGRIIREIVVFAQKEGLKLPIEGPVFVGLSGGADSIALLVLLARYGRRWVKKENLYALHVNHGIQEAWSEQSQKFVIDLCKKYEVPLEIVPVSLSLSGDLENEARKKRKEIFRKKTQVLTGHHGDDLAETLLWRLFTGSHQTHGGGVLFQEENEIRPFLSMRKSMLIDFLKEENESWLDDPMNEDVRFLRGKLRNKIIPVIEECFPQAISHLIDQGVGAQRQDSSLAQIIFGVMNSRLKRGHVDQIRQMMESDQDGLMNLPGDWILKRQRNEDKTTHWIIFSEKNKNR